jgi:hypothetical protein
MNTRRGSKSCPSPRNLLWCPEAGEGKQGCRRAAAAITRSPTANWSPGRQSARPGVEPCGRPVRTVALPQRNQRQFRLPQGANGGRDASAAPRLSSPAGRALRRYRLRRRTTCMARPMARASSSSYRALACTISLRSAGELAAPALPRGRPAAHRVPCRSGYRPGQQHLARFLVRTTL